jgi:hypothetical protein
MGTIRPTSRRDSPGAAAVFGADKAAKSMNDPIYLQEDGFEIHFASSPGGLAYPCMEKYQNFVLTTLWL